MNNFAKRLCCAVLLPLALSACTLMRPGEEGSASREVRTLPDRTDISTDAPVLADKGDPDARFAQALELWRQNQIADAETAFRMLTGDFPGFAGPWTNLGILYAKSNRRDQALGALTRAVALDPRNGVAYNWLGILHREQREYARAHEAYGKALAINPDHALAHYNLAVLYDEHLQQPREALPHYRAYQRLSGTPDLKVMAWVAEIETRMPSAMAAPASETPSTP